MSIKMQNSDIRQEINLVLAIMSIPFFENLALKFKAAQGSPWTFCVMHLDLVGFGAAIKPCAG